MAERTEPDKGTDSPAWVRILKSVESRKVIPGKVSQSRTGLGLECAKLHLADVTKAILERSECLLPPSLSSLSAFSPIEPAKTMT
jgi:hypothetical protein